MRSRSCAAVMCLAALVSSEGCGDQPIVTALHTVPRAGAPLADFYDLPFPDEARRGPSGAYDLSGFPRGDGLVRSYVEAMDGAIAGAGPSAAVLMRFDGPLEVATLPTDAVVSAAPQSTAMIIDITEGSPSYGKRAPILATYYPSGGAFIGDHWLALRPFPGIPLRERTTYAALLTDGLRGERGGPVVASADLQRLLSAEAPEGEPELRAAWQGYAPLRRFLAAGPLAGAVVGAAVFTTQDATTLMRDLRAAVQARPLPVVQDLRYYRDHDGLCHIYTGRFNSPNFQQGAPPYLDRGGAILRDAKGAPQVVREEALRFALSVPNAPMPREGWPVALYAHGTGGDYLTFTREGVDLRAAAIEAPGGRLQARMAVLSIDQVLHGPRDPSQSSPDLTFFNLKNIIAARDNPLQGAADDFQLLRLAQVMSIDKAPETGRPILFDLKRLYFIGHSQGGLTGPLFVSAAPEIRAAVFSGAGAVLTLSLLNKKEPTDIQALVNGVLGEAASPDHPLLNLLQAFFERADPNNYGRLFFREPPAGMAPKSVFQSLGVVDHYTPVPNILALALSMGVQPMAPRLVELPGLALSPTGLGWGAGAVSGNVGGGQATGVLRQYPQQAERDGHFVLFDQWAARNDWSRFLAADIAEGRAALP